MPIDRWLPHGFKVTPNIGVAGVMHAGEEWQIYACSDDAGHVLIGNEAIGPRWMATGLLPAGALTEVSFGAEVVWCLPSSRAHALIPVAAGKSPGSLDEALAFAGALRRTRTIVGSHSLHDAIYVERFSALLPTFAMSPALGDDIVLGRYLTGGVPVSCNATRRLGAILTWLSPAELSRIGEAAGIRAPVSERGLMADLSEDGEFELPGRPALDSFFREHVIDIVRHRERYRALGIEAPPSLILHGPPGCGKTYAVERLVDYLGWPLYQVASGTVGSPYIHETGRKVAELFTTALDHAPSVVVIDEMESFLSDRTQGLNGGGHRVEEVAEFLRRIPEAAKGGVFIVGMTNRLDMIDPAILRRGRFDHVLEVGMPTIEEVRELLGSLFAKVPTEPDIAIEAFAAELAGRPLSDAAFVVREAGRLAARAGKVAIDASALQAALASSPARDSAEASRPRIGFA